MSDTMLVKYTVPVYVEVNIADRSIERVVICDDDASPAYDQSMEAGAPSLPVVLDADTWADATDDERTTALAIALDGEWPAWNFGW